MGAKNYRIVITRGDQHFEAEGDKAFVLQMLQQFEGAETPVATPIPSGKPLKTEKPPLTKSISVGKGISVGEFIRQFPFKKHTDLVLAFGYYLEQHSGLKDFTPADINNCYYEAKLDSSNTSQMLIQNIRRGFMMPAKGPKGKRKRYTLTSSGEEYLKAALAKKPKQA